MRETRIKNVPTAKWAIISSKSQIGIGVLGCLHEKDQMKMIVVLLPLLNLFTRSPSKSCPCKNRYYILK